MKNMSLLYGEDLKSLRLAPAYDIVSTSIYPNSAENMALSIGGKYTLRDITRTSFAEEAKSIGLGVKIAMKQFDTMVENFESALWKAHEELLLQKITGTESICEKILKSGAIQYYR